MKTTKAALSLQVDIKLLTALEEAAEHHGASSVREYIQQVLWNHVSQVNVPRF